MISFMSGSLHVDTFYSLSVSFNEQSQGRASKSTKTSLQGRGTPDSSKPTGSVRPRAYHHKMSDFHCWRRVEKHHQIRWSYIFPQETLPCRDWCQKNPDRQLLPCLCKMGKLAEVQEARARASSLCPGFLPRCFSRRVRLWAMKLSGTAFHFLAKCAETLGLV